MSDLKHVDVTAGRLTENQQEATTLHELESGVDGDLIYWDAGAAGFKGVARSVPQQVLKIGAYWCPCTGMASTLTLVVDRLYAARFLVTRSWTCDRLAIDVAAAGVGGTKARLGIYNEGTNVIPGTLLVDGGEVNVDGIAIVAATISQALIPGYYWGALISDGAPDIQRGRDDNTYADAMISVRGDNFVGNVLTYYNAHAYGALPATFPAVSPIYGMWVSPVFRPASLD